jgi:hypothetical protein
MKANVRVLYEEYVPTAEKPFMQLCKVMVPLPNSSTWQRHYVVSRWPKTGGGEAKSFTDKNHARTCWTLWAQGLELPEGVFEEVC